MSHFLIVALCAFCGRPARLPLLVLVALAGCGETTPQRAPVAGKVTVGGQPLAKGRILFIPLSPNQGPTTSAAIVAGEYKIPKAEGAVVGQNRVEVEADWNLGFAIDDEAAYAKRCGQPLPPNSIPPQYNRESKLVAEVKAGQDNAFDVTVSGGRHSAARTQ
jgi:hypothetical protein